MEVYHLILVGNSGVGKSYLANIFLGENRFVHQVSVESVTTEVETLEAIFPWGKLVIYNIPGLLEADETNLERNKQALAQAFQRCSATVSQP